MLFSSASSGKARTSAEVKSSALSAGAPIQRFSTTYKKTWEPAENWTPIRPSGLGYEWRVSDDGKMALTQPNYSGSKDLFAQTSVIEGAESKLKAQKSEVELTAASDTPIAVTLPIRS